MSLRALSEDVQDQAAAIQHLYVQKIFQCPLLLGGKILIRDKQRPSSGRPCIDGNKERLLRTSTRHKVNFHQQHPSLSTGDLSEKPLLPCPLLPPFKGLQQNATRTPQTSHKQPLSSKEDTPQSGHPLDVIVHTLGKCRQIPGADGDLLTVRQILLQKTTSTVNKNLTVPGHLLQEESRPGESSAHRPF